MWKRNLSILLLIQFLIWLVVPVVSANPPAPQVLPGQGCGYATAPPPGNKCCNADVEYQVQMPVTSMPIVDTIMWGVNQVIGGISNGLILPLFNSVKNSVTSSSVPCVDGVPSTPNNPRDPDCVCIKGVQGPLEAIKKMCDRIKSPAEQGKCVDCIMGTGGVDAGVWTSIGCVKANLGIFIQETILGWGIGFAGGIAFFCMIYAAFMMQTSNGNAESVKKAQQLLTSCITGLVIIILSVFILQLIGVQILRIPGFK